MAHKSIDSEGLVIQTCERHRTLVACEHFLSHSIDDKNGRDIRLRFLHNGIEFDVQVSTADNGETMGIFLPISDPPPRVIAPRLSPHMMSKIYHHQSHYPEVRFLLFVSKPNGEKNPDFIMGEIWREIMRFYHRTFNAEFNSLEPHQ